jgi:hypothetical protein
MKAHAKWIKRQAVEWEKIFSNYLYDKGVVFRIYKESLKLSIKTIKPKARPNN